MEAPSLRSLEGLTNINIGSRGGADMRSALLRVLTDLYVQKLTHTPDEERHYTELALRLIESVDAPTRAAVAAQLIKHLSPPREVIQRLARDVPEVLRRAFESRSRLPRKLRSRGARAAHRTATAPAATPRVRRRPQRRSGPTWPANSMKYSLPPTRASGASSCSISMWSRPLRPGAPHRARSIGRPEVGSGGVGATAGGLCPGACAIIVDFARAGAAHRRR